MENILHYETELEDIIGGRGIDRRDSRRRSSCSHKVVAAFLNSIAASSRRPSAWYLTAMAKTLAYSIRKLLEAGVEEAAVLLDVSES